MAYIIPETLTRLHATVLVQEAEMYQIGANMVMRVAAKNMAENALRRIINDCIIVLDGSHPTSKKLHLDVVVMPYEELVRLVEEARNQGEKDAMRWVDPQRQL